VLALVIAAGTAVVYDGDVDDVDCRGFTGLSGSVVDVLVLSHCPRFCTAVQERIIQLLTSRLFG
jgi:hypothetical protein